MPTVGTGASTFVGRQSELRVLRSRLQAARGGDPQVVVVEGPPGIGKSELMRCFLRDAADVRVLRASGDESETLLAYGVVDQLTRSPRQPLPSALAPPGAPSAPGLAPMVVGADILELLSTLQQEGPVVLAVDDVHWADTGSLLAMLFALRRLQVDRVLTLLTVRGEGLPHLPDGLRRLVDGERGTRIVLEGLGAADLQTLGVAIRSYELTFREAERLRAHTGGSPLHARALLEELTPEQLRLPGPSPLPAPREFGALVLDRLAACSPDTQRMVTAASVLGMRGPLLDIQRLAEVEDPLRAVEDAMAAHLLELREVGGERQLAFPHPLVRAAIYHDLGPARRAGLHTRAADMVDTAAASLRHRVAAAPAADPELAADLVAFAHEEIDRGATRMAAASLILASRLSPERRDRERLLLEAVENLLIAGDIRQAAGFDPEIAGFADTAYRWYVQGRCAVFSGRLADAERLLTAGWESRDPSDRELGAKLATGLCFVHRLSLRGSESLLWAERAVELATGTPWAGMALGARTLGLVLVGRAADALAAPPSVPSPLQRPEALDPNFLLRRGIARLHTDDVLGARADLSAVSSVRTRSGTGWVGIAASSISVVADYLLGDWDAAIVHAEFAISDAEAADFDLMATPVHRMISAVLAARGEWAAAEAHAQRSAATPVSYYRAYAAMDEARIARARGDHQRVISALEPLVDMDGRETLDEQCAYCPWHDIYADALVGVGRLDDAEAIVTPFETWAAERGRHSAMSRAARARGTLEAARGRAVEADEAFRAGLHHAEQVSFPLDHALLQLAYGGFLRRSGKRRRALAELRAARERLARLGAQPYLARCDRELVGCGLVHRRRWDPDRSRLTPQEVSVARLVASGMSNPQVATELFVSINTVEFHLKNVYGKLGIRSRDRLRERLASVGVAAGSPAS